MATQKFLDYTGLERLIYNIDKKYAPIAAILFKGSVDDITNLPALNTQKAGWMYSIKTGGISTDDFVEGAGHVITDGENVACVELITGYTQVPSVDVTPDKDPKALGWFEKTSSDPDVYAPSTDRIADTAKTYYTADTVNKWDLMGGVFDLEGRYLEFGTEFPHDIASRMVDNRTFLYMGVDKKVYTYVVSPTGRPVDNNYFEGTFTEVVDPSEYDSLKEVPLYEVLAGAEKYIEVQNVQSSDDPQDNGWYEKTGSDPDVYTLSTDTTADLSKTYYERKEAYVRTDDVEPEIGKTYFTGAFVETSDVTVDADKFYYTEAALYTKATIYAYDATNEEWVAQSSGGSGDMIPITNAEIDELFI